MFPVRTWQINCPGTTVTNNLPALFQVARGQAKLGRKNVNSADWQKSERGRGPSKTINNFVNRPVAPGCDNSLKPFPRCFPRQQFGFTDPRRSV
jgi:hypothetical protein